VLDDESRALLTRVFESLPEDARHSAKSFHDAIFHALAALSWSVERETKVADRGDGRAGYIDLIVTTPVLIAIELDRGQPRQKSLEKLRCAARHGFAGVLVCREAEQWTWWQSGEIAIWGVPAISPAEREHAEAVRRAWGRCLHEPHCETYAACLRLITVQKRAG
jgi:hypothetical protein